jgi:transcriptional regulator with XRE-family HTH domain
MAQDEINSTRVERYTLTRREVAARLGVSTSTVRRLEWDRLHPIQDARGINRFDPAELEGMSARAASKLDRNETGAAERRHDLRRGRLAATVFKMFARQKSLPEIVVATKQPPELIRSLYREWSTTLEEAEWDRRTATQR